jgi:hypothetical protein
MQYSRNFHFGVPHLIQYKPNRHPLVLRTAFSLREPFSILPDRAVALRAKLKIANSLLFTAFHKHLSGPHVLAGPDSL